MQKRTQGSTEREEDRHDRTLKRRAREKGISEAELVRRLLDGPAVEEGGEALAVPGAMSALKDFFAECDRTPESHEFPEGYRFDREEIYEDRGATGG